MIRERACLPHAIHMIDVENYMVVRVKLQNICNLIELDLDAQLSIDDMPFE